MSNPIDKFPKSWIDPLIDELMKSEYRRRRQFLWHRVQPRLPRFYYKFRSLSPSDTASVKRMREIVVESRLWLSSPKAFNDPFDMSAKIIVQGSLEEKRERWRGILKRQGKRWHEIERELPGLAAKSNEEIEQVAQQQQEQIAKMFGVCSFGGDPRSILMWSHYASNHEGFCLQFEVAKDLRTLSRPVIVEYTTEYPVINWLNEPEFYAGIRATLGRKHKHWKYEREIRLLIPNAAGEYLPFEPDSLRAIIIGCRVSPTTMDCMHQLINERISTGLSAPILYKAVKHDSKYKLVIRKAM